MTVLGHPKYVVFFRGEKKRGGGGGSWISKICGKVRRLNLTDVNSKLNIQIRNKIYTLSKFVEQTKTFPTGFRN